MPELRPTRRRPPRALIAAVAAAVLVAVGIGLWVTRATAATSYRLGSVTTANVEKTLDLSGTASAVHQATTDFQVAGTVSAVDVTVGEQVTAGATIASLDVTALENDVSSAQSTLSSAQEKLTEDETAETATSSATSSAAPATSTTVTSTITTAESTAAATTSATTEAAGASSDTSTLTQAQQAVVTDQKAEDAETAEAASALSQAQSACTNAGTTTSTTSATSSTTTTTSSTSTATGSASDGSTACTAALTASLSAEDQVATDQKAVASAESALAKLLATSSSSTTSSGSTAKGSSTTDSSSSSSSTASSSTSTTVAPTDGSATSTGTDSDTAQQLASDQAAIDSDEASLIEAQESLADAQLTSPISGTVVSVGLAVGESVTAGSTSDAIMVLNSGSYQVTGTLTSTEASEVKVGDKVQVRVAGLVGTLAGTVARVGPVDASSTSYTYPVVVALPAGSHGIASGSSAQLVVTLEVAHAVRAVPTSAIHSTTHGDYLEVLEAGQESRRPVDIGIVGAEYTQVTTVLPNDTQVVLANLGEVVPSSSTDTSSSSLFSGAGPTTGGFTGGAATAGDLHE